MMNRAWVYKIYCTANKKHTIATKQKISSKRKELNLSGANSSCSIPIKDQFGTMYASQGEAAKQLGLWQANIHKCLKGIIKQTGGYSFVYA